MTELKTLKDFIIGTGEMDQQVDPYTLREEAIKYLKTPGSFNKFRDEIDFVMHFFNITEEDLK